MFKTEFMIRQLGLAVDKSKANDDGWITISAPHRNDKNPSFSLNLESGGWKDNATGQTGNIYDLVRLIYPSMSFKDAKDFVDGKRAFKKPKPKDPEYYTGFTSPFWSDENKQMLKRAQERLEKAAGNKLLREIESYDGLTKETMVLFGCGIIDYSFTGEKVEAILIPYPTGAQIYARGPQGKLIRMLPGSKPSDSFIGADQLSRNKKLVIVKSPREFMLVKQVLGNTCDVIGICSGETDKLSEQQKAILMAIALYYDCVFVSLDRDTLPAEEIAFGFARKVCDVIGTNKRIIWLCNIGKLTGNKCKDLTDLCKSNYKGQLLELFTQGDFTYSDYIWNTVTHEKQIWDIDYKGKATIQPIRTNNVFGKAGYGKIYLQDNITPILVRQKGNILYKPSGFQMNDFMREQVIQKYSKWIDTFTDPDTDIVKYVSSATVENKYDTYGNKVLQDNYKGQMNTKRVKFLKDTKNDSYLYFKDTVVHVTSGGVTELSYSDLSGCIWENQIVDRPFSWQSNSSSKAVFAQFVSNVSGSDAKRIKSLESHIGYNLHNFKDPSKGKITLFTDEVISPEGRANGGSGKSLVAKAVGQIRHLQMLDGEKFDPTHRFAYQDVSVENQIILIDDIDADFPFSGMFTAATGDLTVEPKGEKRLTIPFDLSPKFIITSNHPIKGSGSSYKRRQTVVEFANYYSEDFTPADDFGHFFFQEWDENEWKLFDSYMIHCLQVYLSNGLITASVNYERKKLMVETHPSFVEWAEYWIEPKIDYDLRCLFRGGNVKFTGAQTVEPAENSKGENIRSFLNTHPEVLNDNQARTFNKWMEEFGEMNNWSVHRWPSSGSEMIRFKTKP